MRRLSKFFFPLYTLGLLAWFLTWVTLNEGVWPMVLINRYIVYLFALLPISALVHWWRKQRWLLRVTLLLLAFLGWMYFPYALPQIGATSNDGLRVMTYNVLYSNEDLAQLTSVFERQPLDIVALQEVTEPQWAHLSAALQDRFPHQQYGVTNDYGTNAVLSRFPIVSVEYLAPDIDRPILAVKLDVDDQPLTVYAAHLQAYGWRWIPRDNFGANVHVRTQQQAQQAQAILDHAAALDHSHLVLCDCNSRELSTSYRLLMSRFSNAAHAIRTDAAFPGLKKDRDIRHIDYVLLGQGLESSGVFVVENDGGSDHQARVGVVNFQD